MHLESLHIYPLKSGRGAAVTERRAEERGFAGDRRFMAVGPDGAFLSQRTHPRLGLPEVELRGSGLRLCHDEVGVVEVDAALVDGRWLDVEVWGDRLRAPSCGDEAAGWLTELLGEPAELVYMPQRARRPVRADAGVGVEVEVSFADGHPYLVTSRASLDALNDRIEGPPVPMEAFRPNLVIAGAEAWAEDDWDELHIGEARFRAVGPCERCKITTLAPTDPRQRRPDGEPLRTLASFRRGADQGAGGVLFGVNLICLTPGATVRAGDPVVAR